MTDNIIMDDKNKIKLLEIIRKKSYIENGKSRINCKEALAISDKYEVLPTDIVRILNNEKIKIAACQLKCFK